MINELLFKIVDKIASVEIIRKLILKIIHKTERLEKKEAISVVRQLLESYHTEIVIKVFLQDEDALLSSKPTYNQISRRVADYYKRWQKDPICLMAIDKAKKNEYEFNEMMRCRN